MTADEAIAFIQEQLGFRTDLSSTILLNLQRAQTMLEAEPTKPWWLVSENMTTTTTADEPRLEVPENMLHQVDQASLRYIPASPSATFQERTLRKDDYDILLANYHSTLTGTQLTGEPKAYALQGEYFRLFPTPDDAYTIQIIVFKQDTELTTGGIENGWLKWVPFFLIGKAGGLTARSLRDKEAISFFSNMENEGRVALYGLNEAREHADQRYQMGGPH